MEAEMTAARRIVVKKDPKAICHDQCPWGCPSGCSDNLHSPHTCHHEQTLDGHVSTHVWNKGDARTLEIPSDLDPLPVHLRRPPWEKRSPPGRCCLCTASTIWGYRYLSADGVLDWLWVCGSCRGVNP